jgi:hypothetical protein
MQRRSDNVRFYTRPLGNSNWNQAGVVNDRFAQFRSGVTGTPSGSAPAGFLTDCPVIEFQIANA